MDRLDRAIAMGRQADERKLTYQLDECRYRDSLQAERPEGCFCLGCGEPLYRAGIPRASDVWVYCTCPEGQQRREADAARGIAQQKTRLGYERQMSWSASNIPRKFQDWRLESSPRRELVAALAGNEGSLYLWGEFGVGKTGLMIGLAHQRLENGISNDGRALTVRYVAAPDLFTELRATYDGNGNEAQVLQRYNNADVLLLDDLGAEHMSGSGWVEDRLYQIIGSRHREERVTYMTSNFDLKQLAGRIGERIVWRIVEDCGRDGVVEVRGENQRAR